MTNKTLTPAADLQSKIEANRYDYFTLPTLDINIKYRKPNLLNLSYNNTLPAVMASQIIGAYKEAVNGKNMDEFISEVETKISVDDQLVKELPEKGYELLKILSVSPRFMDVPESDFSAVPVPLIAYRDVPEEDAIAFLLNLFQRAESAKDVSGGDVTLSDVTEFPKGKRGTNRRTTGKNG